MVARNPDQPFHKFSASKSVYRQFWTTKSSMICGFWALKLRKGWSGCLLLPYKPAVKGSHIEVMSKMLMLYVLTSLVKPDQVFHNFSASKSVDLQFWTRKILLDSCERKLWVKCFGSMFWPVWFVKTKIPVQDHFSLYPLLKWIKTSFIFANVEIDKRSAGKLY